MPFYLFLFSILIFIQFWRLFSIYRWVITPSWLSGSWISFLYGSSVYYCHLFLMSSASVRSIPFLSFMEPIFAWNVPLVSLALNCTRLWKIELDSPAMISNHSNALSTCSLRRSNQKTCWDNTQTLLGWPPILVFSEQRDFVRCRTSTDETKRIQGKLRWAIWLQ